LILILVGVLLIGWGLALHMDPYSIAGVIAGIGVIIILIGVIRLLIGLINPRSPLELRGIDPPLSAEEGAED
jgi:hypothetical protein